MSIRKEIMEFYGEASGLICANWKDAFTELASASVHQSRNTLRLWVVKYQRAYAIRLFGFQPTETQKRFVLSNKPTDAPRHQSYVATIVKVDNDLGSVGNTNPVISGHLRSAFKTNFHETIDHLSLLPTVIRILITGKE